MPCVFDNLRLNQIGTNLGPISRFVDETNLPFIFVQNLPYLPIFYIMNLPRVSYYTFQIPTNIENTTYTIVPKNELHAL